jgi:acyl-CoA thioester hydrolase|tara:strand:- start:2232 stop:2675 length:444 start_codon:yes stop_codon:yes gene_type:complete
MGNLDKLGWDYKNAHCMKFEVSKDHIDILGHVNNKVYLDWCELVSWDHSKSLGIDSKKYHEVQCACVVIRNNMEYLGSLFEGDSIAISTWITKTDSKLRLSRLFQVIRITDNKTIFRSYVDYVCISLNSFKPKKMPNLFQNAYKVTI